MPDTVEKSELVPIAVIPEPDVLLVNALAPIPTLSEVVEDPESALYPNAVL